MAPEVLRGEGADYRSDLWALGVVLYEVACGHLPFSGRSVFEISSAILTDMPSPLGPPVPPGFWSIIQRCLAKEPMQRYQRAGEVQAALEAVQSALMASPEPVVDRSGPTTTVFHGVQHVPVRKGDVLLLVGTTKGALHTIVLDPGNSQRMYVAISAGGVYRTDDGGATWTAQNRGIRATFMPNKFPEFGQCVHKIVMHPDRPERLFLQNHWGFIEHGMPARRGSRWSADCRKRALTKRSCAMR